ncbi:MAG: hypothetical protein ACFFAN_07235 [Promethearchaeota archaeon]
MKQTTRSSHFLTNSQERFIRHFGHYPCCWGLSSFRNDDEPFNV